MEPLASTCGAWPSGTPQQGSKLYRSVLQTALIASCAMLKADCNYAALTVGNFTHTSSMQVVHASFEPHPHLLQALKPLLEHLPPTDVETVLLAWTPIFQRLVMDNTR